MNEWMLFQASTLHSFKNRLCLVHGNPCTTDAYKRAREPLRIECTRSMKCIDKNKHIQTKNSLYKFYINWRHYSDILAPILPFNDYLCNAYILVNYH